MGPAIDGLIEAREAQMEHCRAIATKLARQMLAGTDNATGIRDWTFAPPRSDDIATWRGATRWWGIEQQYRMVCARQDALLRGQGPFYCRTCEENPGAGWKGRPCLDCEWDKGGRTEALKRAQDFGQPLPCYRCGETLIPGEHSMDHWSTAHAPHAPATYTIAV